MIILYVDVSSLFLSMVCVCVRVRVRVRVCVCVCAEQPVHVADAGGGLPAVLLARGGGAGQPAGLPQPPPPEAGRSGPAAGTQLKQCIQLYSYILFLCNGYGLLFVFIFC